MQSVTELINYVMSLFESLFVKQQYFKGILIAGVLHRLKYKVCLSTLLVYLADAPAPPI